MQCDSDMTVTRSFNLPPPLPSPLPLSLLWTPKGKVKAVRKRAAPPHLQHRAAHRYGNCRAHCRRADAGNGGTVGSTPIRGDVRRRHLGEGFELAYVQLHAPVRDYLRRSTFVFFFFVVVVGWSTRGLRWWYSLPSPPSLPPQYGRVGAPHQSPVSPRVGRKPASATLC